MDVMTKLGRSQSDIPHSAFVVQSANQSELAAAIGTIGVLFTNIEVVNGECRSIRIFLQRPTVYSVALPHGKGPNELARDLCNFEFLREVRCYPERASSPYDVKGWEVRRMLVDSSPSVLLLACWVRKPAS